MGERKLNIEKIKTSMDQLGLNQTSLADKINVSKESISKWLKGEKFPRPAKLLKLSQQLDLSFTQMVSQDDSAHPQFAFRTNKNKKQTAEQEQNAKEMGELLKLLLPYLDGESVFNAPIISQPSINNEYIHKVAHELRVKLNLDSNKITFKELMQLYTDFRIIFIPVMWGPNGDNGLFINLPDSHVTFVYANLEKVVTDFKFWLLHELAHCMTPSLKGHEAEIFADSFASAVLFPTNLAEKAYNELAKIRITGTAINRIKELASQYVISPYTILNEMDNYATKSSRPKLNIKMDGAITNFNKQVGLVSEIIFEETNPDAEKFIETCKSEFNSKFFNALASFLKDTKKEAGIVQRLMNIPIADAKGVYSALVHK